MKKQISPGDRSTGKVVSVMVTAVKGVFPPELSLLGETMAHCYKEYHKISAFLGGANGCTEARISEEQNTPERPRAAGRWWYTWKGAG